MTILATRFVDKLALLPPDLICGTPGAFGYMIHLLHLIHQNPASVLDIYSVVAGLVGLAELCTSIKSSESLQPLKHEDIVEPSTSGIVFCIQEQGRY